VAWGHRDQQKAKLVKGDGSQVIDNSIDYPAIYEGNRLNDLPGFNDKLLQATAHGFCFVGKQ
jgi:hypothetical protein